MKNCCICCIAAASIVFCQLSHAAITPQKIQMVQKNVAEQVWEADWAGLSVDQCRGLIKNVIDQEVEHIIKTPEKSQGAQAAITEKDQEALKKINEIFEQEKTNLTPDPENAHDTAIELLENMSDAGKQEAQKAIDGHILNAIKEKLNEAESRLYSPHYQNYQWATGQADDLLILMQTEEGKQEAQAAITVYKTKHGLT